MSKSPAATMSTTPASPSQLRFGIILMVISVLVSPIIDIFSKLAVADASAGQITATRFAVQAVSMLPFAWLRRVKTRSSFRQSGYHAIRGALISISMICFVTTLKYMPVADAIAIFFVEPIFLTILSSIFLKETVGWRRYSACAVGFAGALLIIQPSFEDVGAVALLPVVAALVIAIYAMMTRALSKREDPWSMQFQTALWGLGLTGMLLVVGDVTQIDSLQVAVAPPGALFAMVGVGLTAAIAGILGVYAYRAAPASTLAPLQYLEIVSATGFAWMVFGEFPDALKWLGIAIVMASGCYIIWREQRVGSKPVSGLSEPPPAP